jgi:hypothetical protein
LYCISVAPADHLKGKIQILIKLKFQKTNYYYYYYYYYYGSGGGGDDDANSPIVFINVLA